MDDKEVALQLLKSKLKKLTWLQLMAFSTFVFAMYPELSKDQSNDT